jgi:iron(II)-dependent oxidoreductase
VGLFPAGKSYYEVFDLAGNVWEWCSTAWQKEAYPFQVKDEWTLEYLRTDVLRVLRGGAFYYDLYYARCASRDGNYPGSRIRLNGFRVVVSAISPISAL